MRVVAIHSLLLSEARFGTQKSWGSRLFGCLVAFWYRLSSSKVVRAPLGIPSR